MSEQAIEHLEARLHAAAGAFPYPLTPDVAGAVHHRLVTAPTGLTMGHRRPVWVVMVIVGVLAGLIAVPQVRAGVLEVLRIGAVRILVTEPTLTPTAPAATGIPRPTPTPLSSLLDLAGQTTLEDTERQVGFPIRPPTYPADLGPPDEVFLQHLGGPFVILVWLDDEQPAKVQLSLHILSSNVPVEKVQPRVLLETTVNGQPALWTEGPYLLQLRNENFDVRRLIEGHVLIWTEGDLTYRLETDLNLEDAVRIAESVKPENKSSD
jgi:hypothetical protein